MSRFEETVGLFGFGVGTSTCGSVTCEVCGKAYNVGAEAREDYTGDSVSVDEFAGMTVCECCFERIEEAVWRNRRLILGWYLRRIEASLASTQADKASLDAILDAGAIQPQARPMQVGFYVRNKGSGEVYDLSTDHAGRPIAVRQVSITNPLEWELIR